MKMKRIILLIVFIFAMANVNGQIPPNEQGKTSDDIRIEKLSKLYGTDFSKKITDNFGKGYTPLYGTRNFRVVIPGIVYRGGANNYYHKTNKRNNKNPLPNDGLKALANEGFSFAVYLYATNYKTAPKTMLSDDGTNNLIYINNTLANKSQERELLEMIYMIMQDPELGPVYLHCWNGWHQSGYASAIVLMQFCAYTNKEAEEYWRNYADGGTKGYDHIIKKIRAFKPFPKFLLNKDEQKKYCDQCKK